MESANERSFNLRTMRGLLGTCFFICTTCPTSAAAVGLRAPPAAPSIRTIRRARVRSHVLSLAAEGDAVGALAEQAAALGGQAAESVRSLAHSLPSDLPALPSLPDVFLLRMPDLEVPKLAPLNAPSGIDLHDVDEAMRSAAEQAKPLVRKGLGVAASVGVGAIDALGGAVRSAMSPEQRAIADKAAELTVQTADVAGVAARATVRAGAWAWRESAPARQELGRAATEGSRRAGEAAAPLVQDLLDDGRLTDGSVEAAKSLGKQLAAEAGQGASRTAAAGLRGAARLLDDVAADVAEPGDRGALDSGSLAERFGRGFLRAAAPYAAAAFALLLTLSALRELLRPVERVASGLLLLLCAKLLFDNWEGMQHAYEVLNGRAPLFG